MYCAPSTSGIRRSRRFGLLFASFLLPCLYSSETTPHPGAQVTPERQPLLLRSIDSLSNPLDAGLSGPVELRGVVTLVRKKIVYVQDQTGAIAVASEEPARLAIGDEVEMHGTLHRRNGSPALHADAIRKLWSGSPPVPLSLKPEQAAEGSFSNRLIDTEGRLLQKIVNDGYLRLTLEGDRQIFGASLELSSPITGRTHLAESLDEGSTLRLVGVCARSWSMEESSGDAFMVLLRSTDDIRVVSPAPWWNLKHAMWLGAAAVVLLSIFYRLRSRALNLRFQLIVEERGRIAREMHDTLAQGFSGLTYQLEGLARELDASVEKRSIEEHLGMALQLVRHCREEAHRSIFALRSLTQTDPDLLTLLMSSCDSIRTGNGVRIVKVSEGKPTPIVDEVLNHLLRIGQEAITNALRHSGASEIEVAVRYRDSEILVEVTDDGKGFEVGAVRPAEAGHFGIMGMKERAKHINACLVIESTPGSGTKVSVRVAREKVFSWRRPWRNGPSRPQDETADMGIPS